VDADRGAAPGPPDGGLLSCYTVAIAEMLYRQGTDWLSTIGLSSVLAVRPAGDLLTFVHHDRTLRPQAGGLRRMGTADPDGLADGLADAYARARPVILVVDAGHLPWAPAAGHKHAPHWLVLDGRQDGRWHVTDRFSADGEHGGHVPWQGWVRDGELAALTELTALRPEQVLRERLAFGDEEPSHLVVPYRWYSAAPHPPHRNGHGYLAAGPSTAISLGGWVKGAAAVTAVARYFEQAGPEPGAFRQADDLWVASRHRRLRALALSRVLAAGDRRLASAGALAAEWGRLPMVLRYAAEAARRGRDKTATLLGVLGAVAQAEAADAEITAQAEAADAEITAQATEAQNTAQAADARSTARAAGRGGEP
jgi:hypothetical protein